MKINVTRSVLAPSGTTYPLGPQDVIAPDALALIASGAAISLVAAPAPTLQQSNTRGIFDRMKATIAAALGRNAVDTPPLNPPYGGQWQPSTAYANGVAVQNAGNVYVNTQYNAVTVSGATAPTGTGPNTVSDGAIAWQYIGPVRTQAPNIGPLNLSGNISAGTSGTLSGNFGGATGLYYLTFLTATGPVKLVGTLTNGSTAVTALSATITTVSTVISSVTSAAQGAAGADGAAISFSLNSANTLAQLLGAGAYTLDAYVNPDKFLVTGGTPFYNVYQSVLNVAGPPSASANNSYGWPQSGYSNWLTALETSIIFETDAPKIVIADSATGLAVVNGVFQLTIKVDGVWLTEGSIGYNNVTSYNSGSAYVIDFSASSNPRKRRKIQIYSSANQFYSTVSVDYLSKIWYPTRANTWRLVFEGDSETGGASTPGYNTYWLTHGTSWATKVGDLLGTDEIFNVAIGGTGYISTGGGYAIKDRMANLVSLKPDAVLLAGNHNDTTFSAAAQFAAYLAYFQALRQALPGVPFFIFGLWPEQQSSSAGFQAGDQIFHNAALAAADPLIFWYSIMADSTTGDAITNGVANSWCTGTGTTAALASNGNCDLLISPNGHPSQAGSDYMAMRYANAIKRIVAAL